MTGRSRRAGRESQMVARFLRITAAGIAALSIALCSACASGDDRAGVSSTPTAAAPLAPAVVAANPFGPASFWRSTLASAPVDPGSRAMVDYLVSTITDRYNGVAAFNAHQYNSYLYTVTPSTPTVDFAYSNCQKKPSTPSGLLGAGGQFEDVPVPEGAVPAVGTDAEISFYSPATDQLWEFWKASKSASGVWSACWGGRIDGVSTSPGFFTGGFGATATGLPNAGGAVRLAEIQAGRIDHAISLAIPAPAVASDFSWPAQRSDGFDPSPAAMREGARLRLDPSLDLTTLKLTPAGLAIARAAQQYGFVVVDKAGSVSVIAEAVDKVNGADPWYAVLKTPDYAVLKNFPWSRLQVIQKDYGKPAS
jgi:hypothetical protein